MNSITKGQSFTLIFAAGAFFVFSSECAKNLSQLAGFAISAVFAFVLFVIFSKLLKDKIESIFMHSLIFALMLISGAGCIATFFNAKSNADLGIDHELLCAIALGFAVIYCASLKFKATARVSAIIFAFLCISLAILFFGAFSKFDLSALDLSFDFKSALSYALQGFSTTAILAIAAVLIIKNNNNPHGKYSAFASLSAFFLNIALSVCAMAVNDDSEKTYFNLAKAAQPFAVQSGEWIYIIIYSILSVFTLSLIVNLAAESLFAIFPKIRFNTLISALLTFVCAYLMTVFSLDTKTVLYATSIGAVFVLTAALFMPKTKKPSS